MADWQDLVGKRILGYRGYPTTKGYPSTPMSVILFDDGETFIRLREQDPYDYHDCSILARIIDIFQDAGEWQEIKECKDCSEPTSYP